MRSEPSNYQVSGNIKACLKADARTAINLPASMPLGSSLLHLLEYKMFCIKMTTGSSERLALIFKMALQGALWFFLSKMSCKRGSEMVDEHPRKKGWCPIFPPAASKDGNTFLVGATVSTKGAFSLLLRFAEKHTHTKQIHPQAFEDSSVPQTRCVS